MFSGSCFSSDLAACRAAEQSQDQKRASGSGHRMAPPQELGKEDGQISNSEAIPAAALAEKSCGDRLEDAFPCARYKGRSRSVRPSCGGLAQRLTNSQRFAVSDDVHATVGREISLSPVPLRSKAALDGRTGPDSRAIPS